MSRPISVASAGYLTLDGSIVLSAAVDGWLFVPKVGGAVGGGARRTKRKRMEREDEEITLLVATIWSAIR